MTDNADAPTDLSVHLLNYEVCVSNDNDVGAIEPLNLIINHLTKRKTTDNNSNHQALIIYIIKRIKLNFKSGNYKEVIDDCTSLDRHDEDVIKRDKNLFLINEQSLWEVLVRGSSKRLEQMKIRSDEELESIKENIKVHHSAKMVFQKKNTKQVKKQKVGSCH